MTATDTNVLSWTLTPKELAVSISRATPTTREMPVAAATTTAAQASFFCLSVTRPSSPGGMSCLCPPAGAVGRRTHDRPGRGRNSDLV